MPHMRPEKELRQKYLLPHVKPEKELLPKYRLLHVKPEKKLRARRIMLHIYPEMMLRTGLMPVDLLLRVKNVRNARIGGSRGSLNV